MILIVQTGYQTIHAQGANLDYGFDWSHWLTGNETIVNSTWTLDPGITGNNAGWNSTTSYTFIQGGTAGTTYRATNTITTSKARVDERSYLLVCQIR
jgi:hypothetical protein